MNTCKKIRVTIFGFQSSGKVTVNVWQKLKNGDELMLASRDAPIREIITDGWNLEFETRDDISSRTSEPL